MFSHSARDVDWRRRLAEYDPHAARLPVSLHAAQLLLARGERGAAEAAYREMVVRQPANAAALSGLARLLEQSARRQEAELFRRRALDAELESRGIPPEARPEVLDYFLASYGYGPHPAQAPATYVADLFDRYAGEYDDQMTGSLGYRGPEVVCGAAEPYLPASSGLCVLDLGCGTGLASSRLRRWARRLVGVDLSAGMVERARRCGDYDDLFVSEAMDFLSQTPLVFDLVVAIDVLNYFGDLSGVMQRGRGVLAPAGIWALTAETGEEEDFRLGGNRRFQHSAPYLFKTARQAGLELISHSPAVLRYEQKVPVDSLVCVLRPVDDSQGL